MHSLLTAVGSGLKRPVTAKCELSIIPARVLSIASGTRAPTRALANQNAASNLRQSGRLSACYAFVDKGKF